MNKKLVVLIAGILLFVSVFFFLTNQNNSSTPQNLVENQGANPQSPNGNSHSVDSKYLMYTPDVLSSTKNTKRVLFFYADWCPTCRPADAEFTQSAQNIPEGVSVIRVNYNDTQTDQNEKELAVKYNVTYQHTFVQINAEGNEVRKWNGGALDELTANVQ